MKLLVDVGNTRAKWAVLTEGGLTRDGRLAGVLTWVDACRAFAEHLEAMDPHTDGGDAA